MLNSASFIELTNGEIARQAGFLSPEHFARVMRKRTGQIPPDLRPSRRKRDPNRGANRGEL
jgi:AraC-like DNA-binding protein